MRRFGGLRVRLTLSYVLLFALVLVVVGLLFRRSLERSLERQEAEILAGDWAAVRGYLRVEADGRHGWRFDLDEAEEGHIVERLRRVLLLTDLEGNILEMSRGYEALGGFNREELAKARAAGGVPVLRKVDRGSSPYLIRQGIVREGNRDYFLAIGLSIEDTQGVLKDFTRAYFLLVPLLLLGIAGMGWLMAGGALQPLNDLAGATKKISSENLRYRLKPRGTADELDSLVATFNAMLDRLERSFLQIQQFNEDASHELRTPITAIRGQLEVALFTARGEEDYRQAIETALQDVERMGHIVQSLLLLSQAENGQLSLAKTRVDLAPVIEEIVHQFQMTAKEKGLRLTPLISPGTRAQVDRVQFERMVANLLSNAVRFTPPGGEIRVALTHGSGKIFLTVSDTGDGIPAEHILHIFDRFYRAVHSEKEHEKGIGLGLSFVDWIVKAHGGTIDVRSDLGHGTTFLVTLPAGLGEQDSFPVLPTVRGELADNC
jgi:heavy metal sensor kinase